METTINIGKRREAIRILKDFKINHYENRPIEITNIHLENINNIFGRKIIFRNNCFVESQTLWELMQPLGNKKTHNSHNLSPTEIFEALFNVKKPLEVVESYFGRYVILTIAIEQNGHKLGVVVEPETYHTVLNKTVNKIITIHII